MYGCRGWREGHLINKKNSTVDSLLWFRRGKEESGLMQTLRPEPDNSPLSLERSHSAPSPLQPSFSRLSVHWEALAVAEAGSHGRGWKDSSCPTGILGHRPSKALALSPSPHPLLPTQVTWLGRCPLVLRMLVHSSRAAVVASWKRLVLRSHWASRRRAYAKAAGTLQPSLIWDPALSAATTRTKLENWAGLAGTGRGGCNFAPGHQRGGGARLQTAYRARNLFGPGIFCLFVFLI